MRVLVITESKSWDRKQNVYYHALFVLGDFGEKKVKEKEVGEISGTSIIWERREPRSK